MKYSLSIAAVVDFGQLRLEDDKLQVDSLRAAIVQQMNELTGDVKVALANADRDPWKPIDIQFERATIEQARLDLIREWVGEVRKVISVLPITNYEQDDIDRLTAILTDIELATDTTNKEAQPDGNDSAKTPRPTNGVEEGTPQG